MYIPYHGIFDPDNSDEVTRINKRPEKIDNRVAGGSSEIRKMRVIDRGQVVNRFVVIVHLDHWVRTHAVKICKTHTVARRVLAEYYPQARSNQIQHGDIFEKMLDVQSINSKFKVKSEECYIPLVGKFVSCGTR